MNADKDLEARRSWYSAAATAYNRVRPRYPVDLIESAIALAGLEPKAKILEIGCGPGIATVEFARRGFSMVCVEPSLEMCEFARQNCAQYPNVEIQNTSFEEWDLPTDSFDAVLAATSFHWIQPEIGCPKVADALRDNCPFILLWNVVPSPRYEVFQLLEEVYRDCAPSVANYASIEQDRLNLQAIDKTVIDSGRFQKLSSDEFVYNITYNTDDYLMLLSTLSPYIALEAEVRNALFAGLKAKIQQDVGGAIELEHLCTFQIMQKS
ncbi:class I SAM-dependent methyltransferase [Microcoleus sp. herbarium14]|uniref:class I SAM-dependent methyltransferase n=1 Tax=Microcoleus sp. herbarium14 TaxID=3055439 RepID=UPI002FD0C805